MKNEDESFFFVDILKGYRTFMSKKLVVFKKQVKAKLLFSADFILLKILENYFKYLKFNM